LLHSKARSPYQASYYRRLDNKLGNHTRIRHCEPEFNTCGASCIHESRALLQSLGYTLSFATRTQSALTWFNHSSDILYLPVRSVSRIQLFFEMGYEGLSFDPDSKLGFYRSEGMIGQLSQYDRDRI
jgi:hypothetical protein